MDLDTLAPDREPEAGEEAMDILARILIVDDDEADLIALSTILERAGHETFVAEGGNRVRWVYGGKAIDVVITDLQIPEVHGLELITVLRDLSPRAQELSLHFRVWLRLALATPWPHHAHSRS